MKPIIIIEAPTNIGLKQLTAKAPGVDKLPAWLKQQGLHEKIALQKLITIASPPASMDIDEESGVINADAVVGYSKKLAEEIKENKQNFSLVIGGDCSILIGIALGLKQLGRYGLLYLDGHTDYVLPEQSGTKAAAGMDLAMITGNGPEKLTRIHGHRPYIEEQHVFAVGNRTYEKDYEGWIRDSDVHYYNLVDARKEGIATITKEFLMMVDSEKLDGFWIHLDVDVLDDEVMPCVDSRQEDGFSYEELKNIVRPLFASPLATGINVTILDPDLDPAGKYATMFVNELSGLFKP